MYKFIIAIISSIILSGCGSPIINNQSGIIEGQSIFIVSEQLIGYSVSVGNLTNHTITKKDLMTKTLKIATSADSDFQKSDVLQIKSSPGNNLLELKNSSGEVIYRKTIYLSSGQSITINL